MKEGKKSLIVEVLNSKFAILVLVFSIFFIATVFAGNVIVNQGRVYDETGYVVSAGEITMFGGSSSPDGWLICDGSAVSRTTYADLFAVIGTTFG